MHVKPHAEVTALATRCFEEDIPPAKVLERAGVPDSTWARWRRKGVKPKRYPGIFMPPPYSM